jgi:hypothetical protein
MQLDFLDLGHALKQRTMAGGKERGRFTITAAMFAPVRGDGDAFDFPQIAHDRNYN